MKGLILCIQYHIWMGVTAVAYHTVLGDFESMRSKFYSLLLNTLFQGWRRKYFLLPDIIQWLTPRLWNWLHACTGLKLNLALSSSSECLLLLFETNGAVVSSKQHIPHICFHCNPRCKTWFGTSIREMRVLCFTDSENWISKRAVKNSELQFC